MDMDLLALSLGAITVLMIGHFLNVVYDRWSRDK
jgi:hypothetical protein